MAGKLKDEAINGRYKQSQHHISMWKFDGIKPEPSQPPLLRTNDEGEDTET
jgi:hypothetical protein